MNVAAKPQTGTPYLRPQGKGDTYDTFKGTDLAVAAGGRFADVENHEQTDTVETSREARRDIKKQFSKVRTFRNVKVRPEAERTSSESRSEVFKGVTIANRWRIGRFEVTTTNTASTTYKVDAEIVKSGIVAKTTMSVARPDTPQVSTKSGWYLFS